MDIVDALVERIRKLKDSAVNDPMGTAKQAMRGMARGSLSSPGDILDMLKNATPAGAAAKAVGAGGMSLGDETRALLDRTDTLRTDNSDAEMLGEIFSPSPSLNKLQKPIDKLEAILVDPKRAIKAKLIDPKQLIDAVRMWKGGSKNPEILSQTGMHVSNPRVFNDKPVVQALVETPGASFGGHSGAPLDQSTFAQRAASGDIQGFDDVLKMYPELRDVMVKKLNNPNTDDLGSFSPSRNELSVNFGHPSTKDPLGVLAHEVSHGIQRADNIPGGGSPDYVASRVGRIAPVAQHRADVMDSALLARRLLEGRGGMSKVRFGGGSVNDVQNAWNTNRAATKGAHPLTDEVAIMAANRTPEDMEQSLTLVNKLLGKVPANSADGYLKLGGEAYSRIAEKLIHMTVDEAKKLGDLSKLDPHGVKLDDLYDINEFTTRALRGVGAYKPFR